MKFNFWVTLFSKWYQPFFYVLTKTLPNCINKNR